MNRFAKRAILVFFILALLFSINCAPVGTITGDPVISEGFEGCFRGADSGGQPIILILDSPETATGGASNALVGSLVFFKDLMSYWALVGQLTSPQIAELTATGEIPITVRRTEADGTVTMTIKFSDGSSLGPLERRGDPPEEPSILTECP